LHRLDGGGIGAVTVVRQQENVRNEPAFPLHGEGFRGDITLLDRFLVGDEGSGIESIGHALANVEAVFRRHPEKEALCAFVADDILLRLRQVFPPVQALSRMGHHHLRFLLEMRRHDTQRNALRHGVERLLHVAAHIEVDLARQQKRPASYLRPAGLDRQIHAAGGVIPVRQGLIVTSVLRLGEPVGPENDLLICASTSCSKREYRTCGSRFQLYVHDMLPLYDYGRSTGFWRNEVAGVLCRPYRWRTWCPFSRLLSTILQCAWLLILWTKGAPPNLAENGRVPMLKALSPASIRPPFARYSHGIEVPAGKRLVVCSGQLG